METSPRRAAVRAAVAALLLSAGAARAQNETLASVVHDLDRKAQAYASGTVTMDPGLAGKLAAFEKALKAGTEALAAGDPRRAIRESLALRSEALRGRAANAPKLTALTVPMTASAVEKFWKEVGVELSSMTTAAKVLQASNTPDAPGLALAASASQEAEATALAQAKTAALSELARRMANGGAFAVPEDQDFRAPAGKAVLPPLKRGDNTPRVGQAQEELNLLRKASGESAIPVDSDYGRVTAAAVLKFQRQNAKEYGLKPTGRMDADTEKALRKEAEESRERSADLTQRGDENLGVEMLQRRLNGAGGFRFLTPDGRYGPRTQDAVRAFQRVHHLPMSGQMDEATWNALIAAEPPAERRKAPAAEPGPLGSTWASKRIPADLAARVRVAADKHGLDDDFFQAVVWAEGGRLGDRTSNIARGPAQITRSAAQAECHDLGWNAVRSQDAANLECGARIMSRRGREYLGENADPMLAASLYNTKMKHWKRIAGERKVPPFRETVSYVTRISRYYCQITGRRLLDPAKHLDKRMIAISKRADREMDVEFALENQTPRPDCSPY